MKKSRTTPDKVLKFEIENNIFMINCEKYIRNSITKLLPLHDKNSLDYKSLLILKKKDLKQVLIDILTNKEYLQKLDLMDFYNSILDIELDKIKSKMGIN